MVPRFFAPAAGGPDADVALPADEAAHLTRVLRLAAGDAVRVFDGRGREWRARVAAVDRHDVRVRLEDPVPAAREAQIAIALAIAVLKGDRMDEVVRDAVMVGVRAIRPLVSVRTEPPLAAAAARVARWQRIALSSAKQCGRAVVPPVLDVVALRDVLAARADGQRVMLVEPSAVTAVPGGGSAGTLRDLAPSAALEMIVGPEGGWADDEVRAAASGGATLVTLGTQTLRADAVPVVAISAVRALWGDL